MVKKAHQNPSGGLNQAGRDHFKRTEGANLKRPQKTGTDSRRVSFAARFAGMKGPMKNEDGTPTRKALALKKLGVLVLLKRLETLPTVIRNRERQVHNG